MNKNLITIQAYEATQRFLEIYFHQTDSDSLAVLLSGMQLLCDGTSADQALFEDWVEITKNNDNLSIFDGFNAMKNYFKNFYKHSTSKNVHKLLQVLDTVTQPDTTNEAWKNWVQSAEKAIQDPLPRGIQWATDK
jgi:hypothetical protein